MLGFQGTGAMITFVADLVNNWDELTDAERTVLLARLKAGRSEDRWLQAGALTRSTVPTTVQRTLLGDGVSLSDGPDALLAKVGSDLLNAAVHVYSGRPQTLGWLGADHSGKIVWEPVVDRIARMPSHPLFELAWDHIACSGDGARVSSVITCVGGENADRMLGILIRLKVGCTGNYMPEAWATLLAMAQNDRGADGVGSTRWRPMLQQSCDKLSDLNLWLSEDRDLTEMLQPTQFGHRPASYGEYHFCLPGRYRCGQYPIDWHPRTGVEVGEGSATSFWNMRQPCRHAQTQRCRGVGVDRSSAAASRINP